MKSKVLIAGLVLFSFAARLAAAPPTQLHMQVYTSPPEGISVTSTLITGERDAILIDAQFRLSDAHRLVALILESKKNLTTVYVSHPHPDHYFGLVVFRQAFPNAKFVALPKVVDGIKASWQNRVNAWKPQYGENIPSNPIIPDALEGNTLTLEGETLQVFGPLQGDTPGDNSFVWIPSLKTVVGGDVVFSGVHFGFGPALVAQKDEWIKTLDQIAALHPEVVVPGHQVEGAPNDASVLAFMKKYMQDYSAALASSKSADEFKAKVKAQYPKLGTEGLLDMGAASAFPAKKPNSP
jgi:glyoxylase-like metal-dependent hydrolase (beta-lactamase superfamily II)